MGSWNGTCGVTQLPIVYGDPVALFFLTHVEHKEMDDGGFCHANHIWTPRHLPVYAKYDDYGRADSFSEEHWHSQFIVDAFKEDVVEKEVGKNEYHDHPVKKDELSVQYLIECIERGRVEVHISASKAKVLGRKKLRIGYMMIHEFVYNHLASGFESFLGKTPLAKAIDDGFRFYHAALAEAAKPSSLSRHMRGLGFGLETFTSDLGRGNLFREITHSDFDNVWADQGIRHYGVFLLDLAFEQKRPADDPVVVELVTELAKYMIFRANFQIMRKFFSPQSGAGSQSTEYDLYLNLNGLVNTFLIERKLAEEEFNDEDFEE